MSDLPRLSVEGRTGQISLAYERDESDVMQNTSQQPDEGHYYRAYGLNLYSSIPLTELPSGNAPADVVIRLGTVKERPESLDEDGIGIWFTEGKACHFREDAGAFLANGGTEIVVDPNPAASPEAIRLSVLGPALGLILHQRGTFALHASAVAMGDVAVMFLGPNRAGKSTMAALMHSRGHPLLCDDVTPLDMNASEVRVTPSFPQIKLWPDSADVIGSAAEMPILHPAFDKRAFRPTTGFWSKPVRLHRLYVLSVAETISITPVAPAMAIQPLLASWYGARFGAGFARSIDQRAHFENCSRLASSVTMRVLQRPATLMEDPGLAAAIESAIADDLASAERTED